MASKQNKKRKTTESPAVVSSPVFLQRINKLLTERPLLLAFSIIAFLFLLQAIFFVSSYQTNDDIGMTFVVSGTGTSPEPDEHLRFSHVAIGFVLKALYESAPAIPWYGLYHILIHFLSTAALLYVLLIRGCSVKRLLLFLLYFAAVELSFLNELQFTVTAFVAGQAGIFLFLAGLEQPPKRSRFMIAAGIVMLAVSCMVRTSSCQLAILLALPILLFTFYEKRSDKNVRKRFALFLGATAVCMVALIATEKAHYQSDPEWRDFFAVNKLKSRFIDWHHAQYNDETKHVFEEVGWSQNDFYMLLTWFFADEDIYSRENLETVLSNFPSFKSYLQPKEVLIRLGGIFTKSPHIIAVIVFFILFSLGSRRRLLSIAGTLFLTIAVMIYLIYTKRLPARVSEPMMSFVAICALFFADIGNSQSGYWRRLVLTIAGVAVIGWIGSSVADQFRFGDVKQAANRTFRETIAELAPQEDQLYVVWGATLPYTHMLPFDNLDYFRNFKLVSLGTTLRTPITKKRMGEFGTNDIYRAICEDDNVFLVVGNLRYLYYYSQYVLEHYGKTIQYQSIFKSNEFTVINAIDETHQDYRENTKNYNLADPYR